MGTLRLYSAHHVYYYIEYDAIVYRETREKRVCLFKRVFIAYRFSSTGLSRMQSLIERCTDPHRYGLIIILFDNICTCNVSILSSCNKLQVYNAHIYIYYIRTSHEWRRQNVHLVQCFTFENTSSKDYILYIMYIYVLRRNERFLSKSMYERS